jgi:hypothetical protein
MVMRMKDVDNILMSCGQMIPIAVVAKEIMLHM